MVRYFYCNLFSSVENFDLFCQCIKITINRQLLSNLFTISDGGTTYYLNYYEGLHNINLEKTKIYKSILFATELTRSIQKNIIRDLRLAYLTVSSNIVPTIDHKNLVSLLSVLLLHCLVSRIPLKLPNFIIKHMFTTKSTTSSTSLPCGALFMVIFSTSESIAYMNPLILLPSHLTNLPWPKLFSNLVVLHQFRIPI